MRLFETVDPYDFESLLTVAERSVIARLRTFLDEEVAPIVDEYWERGEFPVQLIEPIARLGLLAPAELADQPQPFVRPLFEGFRLFEIAKTDASIATYFSGQATMIRSAVLHGGSDEQVASLLPQIDSYALRGAFAITEPDHGSDVARGMQATARRDGDDWILDGRKRWIGSAAYATHLCVVARTDDGPGTGAFLVPTDAAGLMISKILHKASLRIVDNADVELVEVRVPESARLQKVKRFADVAMMLRHMRASVVWLAAGVQAGAYEAALRYARERVQFGKPIAGHQLVQEKIARMLGNLTASLAMAVRLAQRQEAGVYRDEDSALAKYWVSAHMRETVALAREICGGNGIVLQTGVARFFSDAEAVYTYEGTNEISALVVGRAATGLGAFA